MEEIRQYWIPAAKAREETSGDTRLLVFALPAEMRKPGRPYARCEVFEGPRMAAYFELTESGEMDVLRGYIIKTIYDSYEARPRPILHTDDFASALHAIRELLAARYDFPHDLMVDVVERKITKKYD